MSQDERSPGEIGCPKRGVSTASAEPPATAAAHNTTELSQRIARLPFLVDLPAGDGVVVIDAAQAPLGREHRARRLHHTGLVGGAALQHGGTAVPLPRGAEAGE